ncbi:hypothetical protein ATANTOWER_024087 [Ataeniobius toweri]|uniref:Uncharacterized protein n=2 Tax=Goodeidae TaxID=28758 RepID=A0ABU7BHC5_9TELE|nr:hypothetical protein [Ataeniobius toweri]
MIWREDDSFDPNIPEEGPSAPPPGWLEDIHGYQGLTEGGPEDEEPLYPPPPAYNPQPDLNRSTSVPTIRVPSVSEDVAREALLKFVESKWKYSSKPARNLTFKDLKPVMVYRVNMRVKFRVMHHAPPCNKGPHNIEPREQVV